MSLESQLERICVALEALATIHAGPVFDNGSSTKPILDLETISKNLQTKKAEPKPETKKAEPKAEPEAVPAETAAETEATNASLEDLAEKVKTLAAKAGRDAVIAVFTSFGVKKLSELDDAKYIAMDLALAKAITKANAE